MTVYNVFVNRENHIEGIEGTICRLLDPSLPSIVEMATPRPRDDSYLRTLTTIDAKRNALAADVRRLTTQASGSAKTATFDWIETASQGAPAVAALKAEVESLARQFRTLQIQLRSSNLTGTSAAYVVLNAFPEGAVDSHKFSRPGKFKQLPHDTPEIPESGYPSEPVQLPDVTVSESEGRSTRWCDHQVTGEFKNELDGKNITKGLCQLVTQLQAIFQNQPRRRKTFGFLADTRHVIICRAEKIDDNLIFWRTKPMPVLDAAGGWGKGGKALISLFRSGLDKLGRPSPLFQITGNQDLQRTATGTRFTIAKDTIQILREGIGSQSHIISSRNKNNGVSIRSKIVGRVGYGNPAADPESTQLGIVHGDISPNNIIIAHNHAVLIDWESWSDGKTEIVPKRLTATIPYCSAKVLRALRSGTPTTITPEDDFKALFYSLIAIAFGRVPWRASASSLPSGATARCRSLVPSGARLLNISCLFLMSWADECDDQPVSGRVGRLLHVHNDRVDQRDVTHPDPWLFKPHNQLTR
ncbi:hypothetical protein PROFUN_09308 [Planoprotostelium fungivorum]|uniref:Fungal-type protein kinase domain-containing protein n=1 Tax=Planoprotostelium fungivorum TaxID=1890364 RepID=A0A2P6NHA7_9EUKA|nr:hypothetical protein PROFUN_09308 [Planoprotostelium fungivorum]